MLLQPGLSTSGSRCPPGRRGWEITHTASRLGAHILGWLLSKSHFLLLNENKYSATRSFSDSSPILVTGRPGARAQGVLFVVCELTYLHKQASQKQQFTLELFQLVP